MAHNYAYVCNHCNVCNRLLRTFLNQKERRFVNNNFFVIRNIRWLRREVLTRSFGRRLFCYYFFLIYVFFRLIHLLDIFDTSNVQFFCCWLLSLNKSKIYIVEWTISFIVERCFLYLQITNILCYSSTVVYLLTKRIRLNIKLVRQELLKYQLIYQYNY